MTTRQVIHGEEAKSKLEQGVKTLASAVKVTLGAMGRNVVIAHAGNTPHVTKDGVTVARSIRPADPIEAIGADIVRQASIKTAIVSGDGTTTSCILAEALITKGLEAVRRGKNPVELVKEMNECGNHVIEKIKAQAVPVSNQDHLMHVATISANNDHELGKVISDVVGKTGRYGSIRVENSQSSETYGKVENGVVIDKGYIDPHFSTNEKLEAIYENCMIMVCDMELSRFSPGFMKAWENIVEQGQAPKPLLLIAREINGEMKSSLVLNKVKNNFPVVAVKAPNAGDIQGNILQDICAATGATLISEEYGLPLEKVELKHFGGCDKVVVSGKKTILFGAKGSKADLEARIETIKSEIDDNPDERKLSILKARIANLKDGLGVIYAGANTEVELQEKKDRIDDAVCATKAAQEEGIVAGGGVALLRASWIDLESEGAKVVRYACEQPFLNILSNAGLNILLGIEEVKENIGVNVKTGETVNMIEAGIIDPCKVTRVAFENALSVASQLLLCETVSYEGGENA